jgi:hypothetical protein
VGDAIVGSRRQAREQVEAWRAEHLCAALEDKDDAALDGMRQRLETNGDTSAGLWKLYSAASTTEKTELLKRRLGGQMIVSAIEDLKRRGIDPREPAAVVLAYAYREAADRPVFVNEKRRGALKRAIVHLTEVAKGGDRDDRFALLANQVLRDANELAAVMGASTTARDIQDKRVSIPFQVALSSAGRVNRHESSRRWTPAALASLLIYWQLDGWQRIGVTLRMEHDRAEKSARRKTSSSTKSGRKSKRLR